MGSRRDLSDAGCSNFDVLQSRHSVLIRFHYFLDSFADNLFRECCKTAAHLVVAAVFFIFETKSESGT